MGEDPGGAADGLPTWIRLTGEGVALAVRVTPRARADVVEGLREGADGQVHLALRVTATPADGAANAAVEALVARAVGVTRQAVSIEKGQSARVKRVAVRGDHAVLLDCLMHLLQD